MRACAPVIDKPYSGRRLHSVPFVVLLGLLAAAPAPAPAPAPGAPADPLAGYHRTWEQRLPLTGEAVRTPPFGAGPRDRWKVVFRGVLDTGKIGVQLDARFTATQGGEFRLPHAHVRLAPEVLALEHSHRGDHRYVYGLGAALARDVRLTVRLAGLTERLQFGAARLPEVAQGGIWISLWRRGPPPGPSPGRAFPLALWGAAGALALVLLAGLGALAWRRRRRRPADT
jgi:hypothetical protein